MRRPEHSAAPGRGATPRQPVGGPGAGGKRASAYRTRPPRRRSAAACRARHRPGHGRGPDRLGPGVGEGTDRRRLEGRHARHWRSCASSFADRAAILVDRGLVAALGAVAGSCPVPTVLDSALDAGERLPAAVERAATSSSANPWRHRRQAQLGDPLRGATPAGSGTLVAEVMDDGVGGATVRPGGGLAGLRIGSRHWTVPSASPARSAGRPSSTSSCRSRWGRGSIAAMWPSRRPAGS